MDSTQLANLVKNERVKRHKTQEALATMAGVSVDTISRLERGIGVGLESAAAVCAALDISPTDIGPQTESTRQEGQYVKVPTVTLKFGKDLADLLRTCGAIEFDYPHDLEPEDVELVGAFLDFCQAEIATPNDAVMKPSDLLMYEKTAGERLQHMLSNGFIVSGGMAERTNYEIDDDGGTAALGMLLAQWDDTVAVIRIVRKGEDASSGLIDLRFQPKYSNIHTTVDYDASETTDIDDEIPF